MLSYKARCRVLCRQSLAYIEEGRKNRSRDAKRALISVTEDSTKQGIYGQFLKKTPPTFLDSKRKPANLTSGQRITKWKASYFTHPASNYPVPQTSMPLSAAKFMTSLPAGSIQKEAEITMKEIWQNITDQRGRTVRRETTKYKAGALPPAVYEKAKTGTCSELSFPDSYAKSSTASVSNESVPLSTLSACSVVTFASNEKNSLSPHRHRA